MLHSIANKRYNGKRLCVGYTQPDPLNPFGLPPYTLRLKYDVGVTPSFSKGRAIQVSQDKNIWDYTYINKNWNSLLSHDTKLLEVIGANSNEVTSFGFTFRDCESLTSLNIFDTSKVTNMRNMFHECVNLPTIPLYDTSKVKEMQSMFQGCSNLTSVPLFDTSNVTDAYFMFKNCYSLKDMPSLDTSNVRYANEMYYGDEAITSTIPLYNTTKMTNMDKMFYGCTRVNGGSLALYEQANAQGNINRHSETFYNCGVSSQTGSAELSQIPDDWK